MRKEQSPNNVISFAEASEKRGKQPFAEKKVENSPHFKITRSNGSVDIFFLEELTRKIANPFSAVEVVAALPIDYFRGFSGVISIEPVGFTDENKEEIENPDVDVEQLSKTEHLKGQIRRMFVPIVVTASVVFGGIAVGAYAHRAHENDNTVKQQIEMDIEAINEKVNPVNTVEFKVKAQTSGDVDIEVFNSGVTDNGKFYKNEKELKEGQTLYIYAENLNDDSSGRLSEKEILKNIKVEKKDLENILGIDLSEVKERWIALQDLHGMSVSPNKKLAVYVEGKDVTIQVVGKLF